MKIARQYKPEEACSQDGSRSTLSYVHLVTEAEAVYASDSYILVKAPVEIEDGDTDGPIPAAALRASRRGDARYRGSIECGDEGAVVPGYATFVRPPKPEKKDPAAWEKIIPTSKPIVTVGFDINLLARAASALGGGKFELSFFSGPNSGTEQPILLRALGDKEALAVVMPLRLRT